LSEEAVTRINSLLGLNATLLTSAEWDSTEKDALVFDALRVSQLFLNKRHVLLRTS
jgi:hypothetical protein